MLKFIKRFIRWLYRDDDTGRFISKAEFGKRDKATTTRERVTRQDSGDVR
jgi:hypothetical protein